MKNIDIGLYIVDAFSVFIEYKWGGLNKDKLISDFSFAIRSIFLKNNIEVYENVFSCGLLFSSDILQYQMFKSSIKQFNKDDPSFFEPAVFTGSILNYLTNKIGGNLGIRGFSDSNLSSDFLTNILEFKNSSCDYGILIDVSKRMFRKANIVIFSKKEFTFSFKRCIMTDIRNRPFLSEKVLKLDKLSSFVQKEKKCSYNKNRQLFFEDSNLFEVLINRNGDSCGFKSCGND